MPTTRNANSQATLDAAFALTNPGDTINITGWTGGMTITARNFVADMFIVGNNFTVTSLLFSGCTHIKITGLNMIGPSSNTTADDVFFNYGTNNPDITLENCFMGSSNWASITSYAGFFNTSGESHCIMVPSGATANRLILRGCKMKGRKYAGTFYGIDGALIENCDIDYISSDTFKVVGVMGGGTIRNSLFPRHHFPYPGVPPGDSTTGDHADAIVQFTSNCSGWTINGCVFLPLVDDLYGFSGVIFGSNGTMTNMTTFQNIICAPGDAGIILSDDATSSHTNNTVLTYFPFGYIVSQTQVETAGTKLRNLEGTNRADLSTVNKLTNNPAGATGTRINNVYQTRWGASTDAHLYKMEPIDFTPVPGGSADFATQGSNTKGAYDTIAKILAGTWPGPAWDGPTPISAGVTRSATNAATFAAAVAASSSGDTITLAGGNYGVFSSGRQFVGRLTVRSLSYLNPAIFNEVDLSNAWGWTWEDVKFDQPYASGVNDASAALGGYNCKRITITRCEIKGNNAPDGFQFGRVCAWFDGQDILIQHSKVWRTRNGITFYNCIRCTAFKNEITDYRTDGIDLYACQDCLLDGNFIHKARSNFLTGDHCDAIQLAMPIPGDLQPTNNTIRNNIIDIEDGSWTESIFMRSENFDNFGDIPGYRFINTVIENNWIRGAQTHGISMAANSSATIRNNDVIWAQMNALEPSNALSLAAGSAGGGHSGVFSNGAIPLIIIGDSSGNGIATGNRFWDGSYYSSVRLQTVTSQATMIAQGWTISDNLTNKDSPGPARPAFVSDFGTGVSGGGGGAPVTVYPAIVGSGATGRSINMRRAA